jgi:hypothetical protein
VVSPHDHDAAPGTEADAPDGPDAPEAPSAGDRIVRFSVWATVVFAAAQALAAALPDTFSVVSVPVSLALFAVGSVAFVWGFAVAIARSQYEVVTLGGLFFLGGGAAPDGVRRALRTLLAVQVVVAVAAASARPFTELAFGILAPMLGLGMLALWGARHGEFDAKEQAEPGSPRQ